MSSRRNFLRNMAGTAGAFSFLGMSDPAFAEHAALQHKRFSAMGPEKAMTDDDFWNWVRESYTVSPNMINLNNGGVAPQPKVVQDAHIRFYQFCNEAPSYYMWQILDQGREPLRENC